MKTLEYIKLGEAPFPHPWRAEPLPDGHVAIVAADGERVAVVDRKSVLYGDNAARMLADRICYAANHHQPNA